MYQFNIEFEYDKGKSEANRLKHGLSLEEAKILWAQYSVQMLTAHLPENRWLQIGMIGEKMFTCVFTYRGEKVRLISLRRSRKEEVNCYYREMSKDEKEKN